MQELTLEELAAAIYEAHDGDPRKIALECAALAIENERLEKAASAGLRRLPPISIGGEKKG